MAAMAAAFAPLDAPASIIGIHDWDAGPHGWTNTHQWTTLDVVPSGGHTGGWLRATFPDTGAAGPDEWYDTLYTPAANLFAGSWRTNMTVAFDFWASNQQPAVIQVRWASTNEHVWQHTVFDGTTDIIPVGSWTSFRTPTFANYEDWDWGGGSQESFLSDLAAVNWIGVQIWRYGPGEEVYGLDDFRLQAPEPAEYLMIVAALGVAAATLLRKRRRPPDAPTATST